MQVSKTGDELVLDNFGLLSKYRGVTEKETEAFENISTLTEINSSPFRPIVTNEVKLAALATVAKILEQDSAGEAIEKCEWLKLFVSCNLYFFFICTNFHCSFLQGL